VRFELGFEAMPVNRDSEGSVLNRQSTELGRIRACQRKEGVERPLARSRGPRPNSGGIGPNGGTGGPGELAGVGSVAEGEELGSNILHIDERSTAHLSARRRRSLREAARPGHERADCAEVDPQKACRPQAKALRRLELGSASASPAPGGLARA
jgi:hypothetical protein